MQNQPLESKWEKLFKEPPEAVTAYSSSHEIYLKDTEVIGYSLSKSDLVNDRFENVIFKDARFQRGSLTNVSFNGGSIESTSFWGSTLTNVRFENLTIVNSVFAGATLFGVTFKNCKIYNSKIHSLHSSKVTIEDSELAKVDFFDSELDIILKNTRVIEQGMFGGLKPGSRVTLEDSYIGPYSDFSHSHIASFKAVRSELDRFAVAGNIGEVVLDNSDLDFSIGFSNIERVIVRDSSITRLALGHGNIKKIVIEDCHNGDLLSLRESKVGELSVRDCNLLSFRPVDAIFGSFNASNSTFVETEADNMIAKEFVLHNVNFTGETVFKGAQADDTELFKVTFAPGATLDATGSNIPFNR